MGPLKTKELCVARSEQPRFVASGLSALAGLIAMTRMEIAEALAAPDAFIVADGYYENKSGVWGYYATIRGQNHWYMISIEPMFQPLALSDIALILASRATRVTESGSYENKYHRAGYWLTARCFEQWLKISVSNVPRAQANEESII
jgi:hypothetical protein